MVTLLRDHLRGRNLTTYGEFPAISRRWPLGALSVVSGISDFGFQISETGRKAFTCWRAVSVSWQVAASVQEMSLLNPFRAPSGFATLFAVRNPAYPGKAGEPWAGGFNAFGVQTDHSAERCTPLKRIDRYAVSIEIDSLSYLNYG